MLYSYPVFISVTLLYTAGRRLSKNRVRLAVPVIGWLVIPGDRRLRYAQLLDDEGRDLLPWLHDASLEACGRRGMLLTGIDYRRKGRKDAHRDAQAWWCEAPPRHDPLLTLTDMARRFDESYGPILRAQREMGG